MAKKRIIIREIPLNLLGNSWNIWNFLAITLELETLDSRSSPLKTHIIASFPIKFWSTKSAYLTGRWYHHKTQNIPRSWCHMKKTPNPKLNFFFILKYKTSRILEGLNSSLAQSSAELWLAKSCPERTNHTIRVNFWFLSKIECLSHNFGSRYARKTIKGSKDSDDNLGSKNNLIQKMACWVGAQGQVN